MALPGVRTVLKDRFYSLSRTEAPDAARIAAIARRSNTADAVIPETGGRTPKDYDFFRPRNEQEVIYAYGENSELHRAYVELTSGGAGPVDLIAIPAGVTDVQLEAITAGNPMEKAFEAVEIAQSDVVVLWGRGGHPDDWEDPATAGNDALYGFYADNSVSATTNFAARAAAYCKEISDRSNPCYAIIGVKPFYGTSENMSPGELSSHVADLAANTTLIDRSGVVDSNGNGIGQYVSVIAAELKPTGYNTDWGYANGAATYAGFVGDLNSEIAATGKNLFNVSRIRYSLTRPQQESLIGVGVVPVALDFNRSAYVVDALTFAAEGSDYSRLTTMRITNDATQLVRRAARRFIGLPATFENRSALETSVNKSLRNMKQVGALIDASANLTFLAEQNKVIIDLVLTVPFEIRNIEVSISVQL